MITIAVYLFVIAICAGCAWLIFYGIRAKVRYYKSLHPGTVRESPRRYASGLFTKYTEASDVAQG